MMLATFIWNTLGRCCSSSAAVLPSLLGSVVLNAGLLLLADLGGDQPVGQTHVHAMHGGAGGAGEHVLGLDGALAFVLVGLHHGHVGNHAADAHIHLGGLERQLVDAGLSLLTKK
jgi:hypothetical protein